jgi:uncharacterized OB-fold protein
MCPNCQSQNTDWIRAAGTATLYTWVVASHAVHSSLVDQVPYAVGLMELPEGIRVVGNVVGCPPQELEAGMPLEIVFETTGDRLLPNFHAVSTDKEKSN